MRKVVFLSLSLVAVYSGVFAASTDFSMYSSKSRGNICHDLRVINICSLTDQDLNEIMQGLHPEIAIEFAAHTTLSMSFFLKGDLMHLMENEGKFGKIEIKQSFYVRYVEQELILSSNLTDWKPFLEFIKGNISTMLSIQNGQPAIVIDAEINQRN